MCVHRASVAFGAKYFKKTYWTNTIKFRFIPLMLRWEQSHKYIESPVLKYLSIINQKTTYEKVLQKNNGPQVPLPRYEYNCSYSCELYCNSIRGEFRTGEN